MSHAVFLARLVPTYPAARSHSATRRMTARWRSSSSRHALREARRDRAALLALLHALQRAGSGRFAGLLRGGGGRRRRWFGVGGRLHRLLRRRRDRLGVLRRPRSIVRIARGVGLATEELRHTVLVPHGTARVVVEGGCARYDETAFPRGFISVPFFPFFRATDRKLWTTLGRANDDTQRERGCVTCRG